MASILLKLSDWYKSQCNGVWEHESGISISTLDNPGWQITIDLTGTDCNPSSRDWLPLELNDGKWVHTRIEDGRFYGFCDPSSLEFVLSRFLVEVANMTGVGA
jgi:Immunity protein 53